MEKLIILLLLLPTLAFSAGAKKGGPAGGDDPGYTADVLWHWKAENYTIDYQASGNTDSDTVTQNNGIITSGGKYNNALASVTGAYAPSVAVSDGNGIDIESGSAQFWWKWDGSTTLSTNTRWFGTSGFYLSWTTSTRLQLIWNDQYHHLDHTTNLVDGNWHHIRVTWEWTGSGTTCKLYLEGSETATDSDSRTPSNYTGFDTSIGIGGLYDISSRVSGGMMDNFYMSDSLTVVHGYSSE